MSKYPLNLRPEAAEDLRSVCDWYGSQKPGLGLEFLVDVELVFDRLREFPEIYPIGHDNARQAILRRFPYVVYYFFEQDRIEVLAVFHTSREPDSWKLDRS